MAYFPNSDSGAVLTDQCDDCPLGEKECPTLLVQLLYNYDQHDAPKLRECLSTLVADDGECQTRKQLQAEAQP